MVTAHMVPSKILIEAISVELKSNEKVFQPPVWADYVKLGVDRENAPEHEKGWWYTRVASILRKVYIFGPIGVVHIKKMYGGRKNRGSKPERSSSGSGAIIRHALQQLEKAGYVAFITGEGRSITPEGRRFVDTIAHKAIQQIPELMKY